MNRKMQKLIRAISEHCGLRPDYVYNQAVATNIPKQKDGYNCGVYVLGYISALASAHSALLTCGSYRTSMNKRIETMRSQCLKGVQTALVKMALGSEMSKRQPEEPRLNEIGNSGQDADFRPKSMTTVEPHDDAGVAKAQGTIGSKEGRRQNLIGVKETLEHLRGQLEVSGNQGKEDEETGCTKPYPPSKKTKLDNGAVVTSSDRSLNRLRFPLGKIRGDGLGPAHAKKHKKRELSNHCVEVGGFVSLSTA